MPADTDAALGRTLIDLADAMDDRLRAAGFDGDPFDLSSDMVVSPLPFNRWAGHRLRLLGDPPQVVRSDDSIDAGGSAAILARLDAVIADRVRL